MGPATNAKAKRSKGKGQAAPKHPPAKRRKNDRGDLRSLLPEEREEEDSDEDPEGKRATRGKGRGRPTPRKSPAKKHKNDRGDQGSLFQEEREEEDSDEDPEGTRAPRGKGKGLPTPRRSPAKKHKNGHERPEGLFPGEHEEEDSDDSAAGAGIQAGRQRGGRRDERKEEKEGKEPRSDEDGESATLQGVREELEAAREERRAARDAQALIADTLKMVTSHLGKGQSGDGSADLRKAALAGFAPLDRRDFDCILKIALYMIQAYDMTDGGTNIRLGLLIAKQGCARHMVAAQIIGKIINAYKGGATIPVSTWNATMKRVFELWFSNGEGPIEAMRVEVEATAQRRKGENLKDYFDRYNEVFTSEIWLKDVCGAPREKGEGRRRVRLWIKGLESPWAQHATIPAMRTKDGEAHRTLLEIYSLLSDYVMDRSLDDRGGDGTTGLTDKLNWLQEGVYLNTASTQKLQRTIEGASAPTAEFALNNIGVAPNAGYAEGAHNNIGDVPSAAACYACGRTGHTAQKCKLVRDQQSQDNRGGDRANGHATSGQTGAHNVKCYICNRMGHYSRDCTDRDRRRTDTGGRGGNYQRGNGYYNCGGRGHMAKECTKPKRCFD